VAGTIQGGAQAFLAELTAERNLASGEAVDLLINYLNPVKVGPLRALATTAGTAGPLTSVEVRLVDAGDSDTLVSAVSPLMHTNFPRT
jgi:hypothetical protein